MTKFGEGAAQLCSIACQVLGWRPAEFWKATPAELALAVQVPEGKGFDLATIEELRRRFPDEPQARPTNMKAAAPTMQTIAPR